MIPISFSMDINELQIIAILCHNLAAEMRKNIFLD